MTPSLRALQSAPRVRAGVGDDLISIGGGIASGSLFGGDGNDSFNFTGGASERATGVVDTGSGIDSVLLGAGGDSITLTGALTSTSVTAGSGDDSIVSRANVASGYLDISAGAEGAADDTLNFLPSSVSVVSTTIKGGLAQTWSVCMAPAMWRSINHPAILSLVEAVRTPCCSPDQY